MHWSKQQPMRREEQGRGSVWNTTLIFITLAVLTAVMVLFVKALVTGSIRPF